MATPSSGTASLLGANFAGYQVLGLIGRGAMGTVYLAEDVSLRRQVALKVLLGSLAHNPQMVESFQLEARAAAPLRHPNIVRVYNAGMENGTPFIAMEYVEGEPLDRFIRRRGNIPWQTALYLAEQVADALSCAHDHGLVHRDVKPGNILLDREGRARLSDFGIANAVNQEEGRRAGAFIGTPHYMSPEQCSGKHVTPQSDLFSLGVMLYRLISGRLPFQSDDPMELINKIKTETPPRLNRVMMGVPDDVARAIAYLLEKNPENRPADARAVVAMIRRLHAEQGGRSALPAALSAFIKEQADIRQVQQVPRKKTGGGRRTPVVRVVEGAPFEEWFNRFGKGALAVVMVLLAVFAGAQTALAIRSTPSTIEAPVMASAQITPLARGLRVARLASEAYRAADVAFVTGTSEAIISVEGKPGSLVDASTGLLSLDLETDTIRSLRPPFNPVRDSARIPLSPYVAVSPLSEARRLSGAVVVAARINKGQIGLFAHYHDRASATGGPLMTVDEDEWSSAVYPSRAIPHPVTDTLCLVQYDDKTGMSTIVEHNLNRDSSVNVLVQSTSPIIPASVAYNADGSQLLYVKASSEQKRELWVVASGGVERDGMPIAIGSLHHNAAFDPSGRDRIAVGVQEEDNGDYAVHIVDGREGRTTARLGPGIPGRSPWHPSGGYMLIASAVSEKGVPQIAAVETTAPYRRVSLTNIAAGVGERIAVSPDGKWAVAPVQSEEAQVVLVDLSDVAFTSGRNPMGVPEGAAS